MASHLPTHELSTRVERTAIGQVKRDQVAYTAHALLNGARNERGDLLIAAAALLFAAMVERCELEPEELFRMGHKMLHASDPHHFKTNASLESLRDFAGLRARSNPII